MTGRSIALVLSPLAILAAAGLLASCSSSDSAPSRSTRAPHPGTPPIAPPALADESPVEYPGLHNVVAYHDGFYSGSVPEGGPGFDSLAGMGVRTIISVDGAEPEVAAARLRGIRYIHLPIGYDGFDQERKLELVRATRDAMTQGPVYIHCHHGKHRSAGAAATIAASLGWLTPELATARMKVSGTAPNYTGLYACAAGAAVLSTGLIDSVPANFPEVSHPADFVKAMVEIDEIFEHLKSIEKAGWTTPKDHPDLVPVAEAGRMADLYRIVSEDDRAKSEPADFLAMLRAEGERAQSLEDLLAARELDTARLSGQFALIAVSCKECHAKYRDRPIAEP